MGEDVRDFVVPDLGEGLEEATVVAWHVEVGEPVALNAPLCTLETAKAEVEIPSPFAGSLVARRGEPGETLAVGSLLARIATGDPVGSIATGDPVGSIATGDPVIADNGGGGLEPASDGRRPVLVGYGVMDDEDRRAGGTGERGHPAPTAAPTRPCPGEAVLAKPPVRRLARSLGVDLRRVSPGSGPGGIVTRADVEAAAADSTAPTARTGIRLLPLTGVRAQVAKRMAASRTEIPDATCSVEVDAGELLALRESWRVDVPSMTPFAVLCRLLVDALSRHPSLNASYVDEGPSVRIFPWVHLGIGTATERGLVVPVLRDAQHLDTAELAKALATLVEQARAGNLAPAALSGSTFTVSNFGALGIDDGIPVINPPEAAVLGVGAIKERPMVVDGVVTARPTVRLTLAFDHRVSDGAQAGAFLVDLRRLIEAPALALLHA